MMTVVNEMFGVKGALGGLAIEPKLVKEQFDKDGQASIGLTFRGLEFKVTYNNMDMLDFGEYKVSEIKVDDNTVDSISAALIDKLAPGVHAVSVTLSRR